MPLFLWSSALAEPPNVTLPLRSLSLSAGAEDGLMCFPASACKVFWFFCFRFLTI